MSSTASAGISLARVAGAQTGPNERSFLSANKGIFGVVEHVKEPSYLFEVFPLNLDRIQRLPPL